MRQSHMPMLHLLLHLFESQAFRLYLLVQLAALLLEQSPAPKLLVLRHGQTPTSWSPRTLAPPLSALMHRLMLRAHGYAQSQIH
jgi:hypothetical protein